MKKANVKPRNIFEIVEKYLPKVEGIESVVFKEDIINSKSEDKIVKRLQNMVHPIYTPEIFPIVTHGYIYKNPYGTGHDSPYDYDTHVPLIFAQEHFEPFMEKSLHATVDIAPTIAKRLGITNPEFVDGKVLPF